MRAKRLKLPVEQVGHYLKCFDQARVEHRCENGVFFTLENAVVEDGGTKAERVVLFREPHHSDRDIRIATARINALYFSDELRVTDFTVGQAA